jgi:drug/metabolite transporter (DMT)-like permease
VGSVLQRPGLTYVVTAAVLACVGVALVTYPIMFALVKPNRPGPLVVALSIAVAAAATLTWYSRLPKPRLLSKLNFVVIPAACGLMLAAAYALAPQAVGTGVLWLMAISLMTYMAPAWLFAGAWIVHAIACFNVVEAGQSVEPPRAPSAPA